MADSENLIHLMIMIKKLDSISDEKFHDYWKNEHKDIFLSVKVVKEKVLKYNQFHIDPKIRQHLREIGAPTPDYDGIAEVWGRSVEDLMGLREDEEFKRVVLPDEPKFFKADDVTMMVGTDFRPVQ